MVLDRDYVGAEQEFRKARSLKPGLVETHTDYGWYLAAMGRLDEALVEMRHAKQLDPLSPFANIAVATILMYQRQDAAALREFESILELYPNFGVAHYGLGRAQAQARRYDEAVVEFDKALSLLPRSPTSSRISRRSTPWLDDATRPRRC